MGTLDQAVADARANGLSVDADGRIQSQDLAAALKESGSLEAKRAFSPLIGELIEAAEQKYQSASGTPRDLAVLKDARQRYENGERVMIDQLTFYDPAKGNIPKPNVISVPLVNSTANTLNVLSFPLSILGQVSKHPVVKAIGSGALPISSGMKSLNKAYKEAMKEEKDPLRIARYTVTGVGAILEGLPTTLGSGPLNKFVYLPLTTAYKVNQGWMFLRMLYQDPVKAEMPALELVREDLHDQTTRYRASREKYANAKLTAVDAAGLEGALGKVNGFLRHHVEKLALEDIDIEFDSSVARIRGAPTRADMQHDTFELSAQFLPTPEPLFAWAYAHEAFHLDGTKNEGKANYRTDRLLEDMAAHDPDAGYDLAIEEMRFAAVGHAYATRLIEAVTNKLKEEIKASGKKVDGRTRDRLIRTAVYQDLQQQNLTPEDLRTILKWAFPKAVILSKVLKQGVLGTEKGGAYTLDYYKLLKQESVL